jgi:PAS domain S-box-containing protein
MPKALWRLLLVPVLVVTVTQALRPPLAPWLGPQTAPVQMFAFLAVFIAAWAGGLWAGLVTVPLSIGAAYVGAAITGTPLAPFDPRADVARIALFTIISIIFSVLTESHLRAQRRLAEADAKTREERERLRLVADHISVQLANLDRNWRYKFVNRAYAQRYGTTPADLIGRNAKDVLDPGVIRALEPHVTRVLAGESVEFEVSVPSRNGVEIVHSSWVPERDERGTVVGWVAVVSDVTNARQAETRLRNFEFLVHNASDFIGMCDLDFKPFYVNKAGLETVGLDAKDFPTTPVFDFFFPEDVPFLQNEFFPKVLSEAYASAELRFRHFKTGEATWMEYSVVRLKDADDRPIGYATISRNLSAHKRAENLLLEVAREKDAALVKLRELADSMPQIVWSAGPDGMPDYYNRRWYELTGQEQGGDSSWSVIHADDRDRSRVAWEASLATGQPLQLEYRLVFPSREPRWYLGRCVPLRDETGRVVRWYGTSTDIHDQKMVEAELAENRGRLLAALDASVTGTFQWDLETNELDWDDNLDRLFGLNPGTTARSLPEFLRLVHPHDRQRVVDACQRCADGAPEFEEEFRVVWPDGTLRWLYDKGRVTLVAGRRVMTGACADVTERRQKEEALRTADRQKDEFLGMLAHELRNPLAPMAYSAALLERHLKDPSAKRPLDVINRQVRRMTRIVDDLLDISRVTQGKVSLKHDTLDLAALVGEAVEASRSIMDARKHKLRVDVRNAPLSVSGDAVRLGQVLENLLNNAAKYTPAGGEIVVTVRRDDSMAVVSVRDTGVGISAAMLPRIFDLFVQADTSLDRSEGGLGIGLTLVDRLARLHGGSVEVRSEGLGFGSEFIVRIPALAAPSYVPAPALSSNSRPACARRILVIDDNVDSAESLKILLEMQGHDVEIAHNGSQAVATALQFRPHVVLLDIGLPGMDGFEVVREFRGHPGLASVIVIATTGYGRDEDRLRCLDAGFNDHLTKPVEIAKIEDILATVRA